MYRFVHVGFNLKVYPQFEGLKFAFSQMGDWIKYSQGCWILWTDKSVGDIYTVVKALVGNDDQFIIAPIDLSDVQGWMPKWVWDWISSKRAPVSLGALGGVLPPPQY